MGELASDEKGDLGEDRARVFLRGLFHEITSRPSPDRGSDLICSGPRWLPTGERAATPVLRLQVKSGHSYNRGFEIGFVTLDTLLQRIEREPVVVLYYHDADADYIRPDCFLILHEWLIRHLDDVRACLKSDGRLKIPHTDFEHMASVASSQLQGAIEGEFSRATRRRGHVLAARHDQLPEYAYLRQFAHD